MPRTEVVPCPCCDAPCECAVPDPLPEEDKSGYQCHQCDELFEINWRGFLSEANGSGR